MQALTVRVADASDRHRWNEYVATHGQPPLNLFEWSEVLRDVYGALTRFLVTEDGHGRIVGVLALYEVSSPRGRALVYSTRHGFLADDDTIAVALLDRAKGLYPRDEVEDLVLTSGYRSLGLETVRLEKTTLVLPLGDDADESWDRLRGKSRNMIRKADRAGVRVDRGFRYLEDFYRVYERHMVKLGVPIHSREFFSAVRDNLPGHSELVVAVLNGEVIGGTVLLFGRDVAIYPYQAAAQDRLDLAPNQAMIWEAARLCAERGVRTLDMGESQVGGATYRFKRNFGGEDRVIHYYYPLRRPVSSGEPSAAASTRARARVRELADALFDRAPSAVRRKYYLYLNRRGRLV